MPFGTACDCTPYPQLAAAEIASIARRTVHAFNDAGPGLLSNDVLQQVRSDPAVTTDVENADVVLIEVGANDVAFSSACGTDVACYRSKLPRVTTNIAAIVSRVRQLTSGRRVAVVMLDYWNVWLGGQYARAKGTAYTEAANGLTETFGEAIRAEAVSSGSIFVDLRTAFRGPDHDHDETALLSGDGDHPNAEGHERIAETIMQALATG